MRSDRGRMFASFAVRNYRVFFAGALISNIGTSAPQNPGHPAGN